MEENKRTDEEAVEDPLRVLLELYLSSRPISSDLATDSFPKSSNTDQRAKFCQLLDSSLNTHLNGLKQELKTMLQTERSSFELVLFLNAQFENALRNTLYFCFHRILFCDDRVLKDWLPYLRIDTETFLNVVRKITKDSNLKVSSKGNQISINHATESRLKELFSAKSEKDPTRDLASNFLKARNVRNQIIHGSKIGRTQAAEWGKLTNITEAQSFRACIAIFSMLEAFDELVTTLFFKPIQSKFNPFQPDMRGKGTSGARANEHQTKLILESCGVKAPVY